jgi:hypothetical protein
MYSPHIGFMYPYQGYYNTFYGPYTYMHPYLYNNLIGSQVSSINQSLFNSGFMLGVNQIANSNNIRF